MTAHIFMVVDFILWGLACIFLLFSNLHLRATRHAMKVFFATVNGLNEVQAGLYRTQEDELTALRKRVEELEQKK